MTCVRRLVPLVSVPLRLQAFWVFQAVQHRRDQFQFGYSPRNLVTALQAFRGWLLSKCDVIWPRRDHPISDPLQTTFVRRQRFHDMSLKEVWNLARWDSVGHASVDVGIVFQEMLSDIAQYRGSAPSCPGACRC